jgi:lactocepin
MTGSSNAVKGTSTYSKPVITLTAGSKQIKVSWSKVEGVTNYDVYYTTSKTGTYKKLATTTSTSYTAKKLTTGKTYYFKIRGYKTYDNGKTKAKIYTDYSAVKNIKAK